MAKRGCVFFNFGTSRAVQLFVAIHSLRQVYAGPITLFLIKGEPHQERLGAQIQQAFSVSLFWIERPETVTKSNIKPMAVALSPYDSTIAFDSDLLFVKPIDPLWEPLEEKGFLLTRFHPNPYGVDGHAARPGFANRIQHLNDIKSLLTESEYQRAMEQLLTDEIDVNTGVVGYRRGKGDAFLRDWAGRIERGRSIVLVDEMTAVALRHKYEHFLADEKWNCPADEYFRKTNLREAAVIHYFADGERLPFGDIVLGRAGHTWAAWKWFDHFYTVRSEYDIQPWCRYDHLLGRTLTDKMTGAAKKMVLSTEFGQRLRRYRQRWRGKGG